MSGRVFLLQAMQVFAFVVLLDNQGLSQIGPTPCSRLNEVPDAFDFHIVLQWNSLAQICLSNRHIQTSIISTHVVPNSRLPFGVAGAPGLSFRVFGARIIPKGPE